ncbi:hypothetical protein BJV77DRAFT_999886, partial [Russula vinacea]
MIAVISLHEFQHARHDYKPSHSASLKEHGSTSGVRQPGLPGNTPNATCPAVDILAFEFL